MSTNLTPADGTRARYLRTKGKQFGNLHERMRWLVALAEQHHDEIHADVWNAIYDLETEVSYCKPINHRKRKVTL